MIEEFEVGFNHVEMLGSGSGGGPEEGVVVGEEGEDGAEEERCCCRAQLKYSTGSWRVSCLGGSKWGDGVRDAPRGDSRRVYSRTTIRKVANFASGIVGWCLQQSISGEWEGLMSRDQGVLQRDSHCCSVVRACS